MSDYVAMSHDTYRARGGEGPTMNVSKDFPSEFQAIVQQIDDATQRVTAMRKDLYRKVSQLSGDFTVPGPDGTGTDVSSVKAPIIVQQRNALRDLFAELDELAVVINQATTI